MRRRTPTGSPQRRIGPERRGRGRGSSETQPQQLPSAPVVHCKMSNNRPKRAPMHRGTAAHYGLPVVVTCGYPCAEAVRADARSRLTADLQQARPRRHRRLREPTWLPRPRRGACKAGNVTFSGDRHAADVADRSQRPCGRPWACRVGEVGQADPDWLISGLPASPPSPVRASAGAIVGSAGAVIRQPSRLRNPACAADEGRAASPWPPRHAGRGGPVFRAAPRSAGERWSRRP